MHNTTLKTQLAQITGGKRSMRVQIQHARCECGKPINYGSDVDGHGEHHYIVCTSPSCEHSGIKYDVPTVEVNESS